MEAVGQTAEEVVPAGAGDSVEAVDQTAEEVAASGPVEVQQVWFHQK